MYVGETKESNGKIHSGLHFKPVPRTHSFSIHSAVLLLGVILHSSIFPHSFDAGIGAIWIPRHVRMQFFKYFGFSLGLPLCLTHFTASFSHVSAINSRKAPFFVCCLLTLRKSVSSTILSEWLHIQSNHFLSRHTAESFSAICGQQWTLVAFKTLNECKHVLHVLCLTRSAFPHASCARKRNSNEN